MKKEMNLRPFMPGKATEIKKATALELAKIIKKFNTHLPSEVFTALHNAAYALEQWAQEE